jgi:histidinol dehydrogenase
VRARGDALRELTERHDGVRVDELAVGGDEFAAAERSLSSAEHAAIETAISTVHRFHAAQMPAPLRVETAPGVVCERRSVPIRAVGLYVPAGSAPLPSTAIMLAVPAAIAGCPVRALCTPPAPGGGANPAVLVAARKAGVDRVYKVGGAQAVAAMAYGTASVPKCDKIFGPGNAWVTAAKLLVASDAAGAAADLPAGVTEVLVIADDGARADFVAADLLAQAEHSVDAQCLLVTDNLAFAHAVAAEVERQRANLTRGAILSASIANMRLIVVEALTTAFEIANDYAPEHLLLEVREPEILARERLRRPVRCFSAVGRRSRWAIIAAAPITRCRPMATREPTAGCRSRIFKSASRCRNSRARACAHSGRLRRHSRGSRAWTPMRRPSRSGLRRSRERCNRESVVVARTPGDLGPEALFACAVAARPHAPACQRGTLAAERRYRLAGLNRYPEPQPQP